MKTIFEYIKPQFKKLFWGLSIKFIGTSMDLCIPWILAYMIDNIISKKNIKEIYLWGVLMIICSFIGVFANIYANRNASAVGRDVNTCHDRRSVRNVNSIISVPSRMRDVYKRQVVSCDELSHCVPLLFSFPILLPS